MARTDMHTEAMLRHLGAAYYESLHGRATAEDVARARAAVEETLSEEPSASPAASPAARTGRQHRGQPPAEPHHLGRFHSRVCDVMTTEVVTVDRITPYKEIARLLAGHHVSAVPVLTMGRHVAGVVSEDDLLAAQVRELLAEILLADPASVRVSVHGGVVTLTGGPWPEDQHELIPVAVRLIWDIDGVVDVADRLGAAAPAAG